MDGKKMKLFLCFLSLFILQEVRVESCPPVDPNRFGICAVLCRPDGSDSACPEGQKCCHNGCGFNCQTAVADKTDAVPAASADPSAVASVSYVDSDCPKRTDYTGSCTGDLCPVMRCSGKCCYDGCSSYCQVVRVEEEKCPLKKPSGNIGCKDNLCSVMRCRTRCCYDGCKSFCYDEAAAATTPVPAANANPSMAALVDIDCPKRTDYTGRCTGDLCPVMLCSGKCCYDGCTSYCRDPKPTLVMTTTKVEDEKCPMKPESGNIGCSENRCSLLGCPTRCCYDGCYNFCYLETAAATTPDYDTDYPYDPYDYGPYRGPGNGAGAQAAGYNVAFAAISSALSFALRLNR